LANLDVGHRSRTVKISHHIFGILLVAAASSGCIPYHAIVRPGADGFIVDAQTGQPITGARVTMASAHDPVFSTWPSFVPASAESTTNGAFTIPAQRRLIMFMTWSPIEPPMFDFTVEHDGHQTYEARFLYPYVYMPDTTNFSQIHLQSLHK